jgi:DNA-binding beta-propeller fold protein YncE
MNLQTQKAYSTKPLDTDTDSSSSEFDNYLQYTGPNLKVSVQYPAGWKILETSTAFTIYPPIDSNNDCFADALFGVTAFARLPFEQLISEQNNEIKRQNFSIIESTNETISNSKAHSILSIADNKANKKAFKYECATGQENSYKIMKLYTIIGNKALVVHYVAAVNDYSAYFGVIKKIMSSMNFEQSIDGSTNIQASIILPTIPVDLAVNPMTDKVYIAADKIYVIDGSTGKFISNITTGGYLSSIAINQVTNTIYASSLESRKIYIIDGYSDQLKSYFNSTHRVGSIALDSHSAGVPSLIFLVNKDKNTVSIRDGDSYQQKGEVSVGQFPNSISIDPVTKRAFVANFEDNTISVIDYITYDNGTAKFERIGDIEVGAIPLSVVVNPNTGKAYAANSGGNTISVIDYITYDNGTAKFERIGDIEVDLFPNSLAINPEDGKIYSANRGNNTISIVDSSASEGGIKANATNMIVETIPSDLAINPSTGMIYILNPDSKSLSIMNGTTFRSLVGITLTVSPSNAGFIECNDDGRKVSSKQVTYVVDSLLNCEASANNGFQFSSWAGDLLGNQASTSLKNGNATIATKASHFGTLMANFVTPIQISLPIEIWAPLYGIIPAVIAGTLIPRIMDWHTLRRQRDNLSIYRQRIDTLRDKYLKSLTDEFLGYDKRKEYLDSLDIIKIAITRDFESGDISTPHYEFLKNKFSEYKERIVKS